MFDFDAPHDPGGLNGGGGCVGQIVWMCLAALLLIGLLKWLE